MRVTIDELKAGHKDPSNNEIKRFYAFRPPQYAVYQTPNRVSLQYSDEDAKETEQRRRMAPLNGLRAQIDGLIDGWRNNPRYKERAQRYDARVAAALILCLEEDVANAQASLSEIKADILGERNSLGRIAYLACAFSLTIALVVLLAISVRQYDSNTLGASLSLGGIGGVMGAFFSIAIGIRNRTVLTDLNWRDNFANAILRVIIGFIAAWILIISLRANLVGNFTMGGQPVSGKDILPETTLIIGFVAGFLERLVPDILSKAGKSEDDARPTPGKVAGGGAPGQGGKPNNADDGKTDN